MVHHRRRWSTTACVDVAACAISVPDTLKQYHQALLPVAKLLSCYSDVPAYPLEDAWTRKLKRLALLPMPLCARH